MKKLITKKLLLVFFAAPAIVFAQSISQISTRIDSLEAIKKDLTQRLNLIDREIELLKSQREALEITEIKQKTEIIATTSVATHLLSEPDPLGKKLIEIPKNSEIRVLEYQSSPYVFYKAIFNSQVGFIWEFHVVENSALTTFKKIVLRERSLRKAVEDSLRRQRAAEYEKTLALKQAEEEKILAQKQAEEEKSLKIKQDEEAKALKIKKTKDEAARRKAEADKAIARFGKLKATYGEEIAAKIMQNKIWLGMSKDMAIESIGKPGQINRTVSAGGVREQWVYNSRELYLYFENGILASWQD